MRSIAKMLAVAAMSTLAHSGVAQQHVGALKQVVSLNLALRDGQFYLGEIPSQISDESVEAVEQETLLKLAEPILKPEVVAAVRALPVRAGYIKLDDLKTAGLPFGFDIGDMTLSFFPTADQRPGDHVTLGQSADRVPEDQLSRSASFSGYVNLTGSMQHIGETRFSGRAETTQMLSAASAVRVMGLVIENEATLDARGTLMRQGTRAVFDDTAQAMRYSVGDVAPGVVGMQTGGGLVGFSVEKSYGKLQPQKNIRPTGLRSFRLERPSQVDIVVNGQVVRKLQMPPGDHDISELPLKAGENALTLEIIDDTGKHTTLKFKVFFDHTLLAPGVDEWGVAAGYRSVPSPAGLLYFRQQAAVTGYYQRGVAEDLTVTLHSQASAETTTAGFVAVTPTRFGQFSAEVDGSRSASGKTGTALALTFTPEAIMKSWDMPGLAQFAGEFRSAGFTRMFASNGSGGEAFYVNGFYSLALPDDYTVALSGGFSFAESGAKPGVGLSISKTVQPDMNWLLTANYDGSTNSSLSRTSGPLSLMGRLSIKLDEGAGLSFTQDGFNGKSIIAVASEGQAGQGRYAIRADVEKDPHAVTGDAAEAQVDFGATYSDPRFDLSATRSRRFFSTGREVIGDVSTVSASGAIAFADDHVAVGRPVSDSFAIVIPHESLENAALRVGGDDKHVRPSSDRVGPLLVSDLPSYSDSQLPVAADDAPAGYDIGAGVFNMRPNYKSGYVLQVGSEYSITALGTLEAEGKPLSLLSGLAKEQDVPNPHKVVVFTNAAGRFCAEGLKAGRWRVEMIGDPPKCFELRIPEKTAGLFDATVIREGCKG
jgi:outer membrane usher protein